jgi:predicted flavoprotein YhiN
LSGPAVLQISLYWQQGAEICIDLAPGQQTACLDRKQLREWLPRRLADRWLELNPTPSPERLHSWKLRPAGTEGFNKAEVTGGGVDTRELDSKTMEARRVPGLFFIGEVVDVTGWLGGYNFQWAWSSGYAAGQAL